MIKQMTVYFADRVEQVYGESLVSLVAGAVGAAEHDIGGLLNGHHHQARHPALEHVVAVLVSQRHTRLRAPGPDLTCHLVRRAPLHQLEIFNPIIVPAGTEHKSMSINIVVLALSDRGVIRINQSTFGARK